MSDLEDYGFYYSGEAAAGEMTMLLHGWSSTN